VNILRYLRDQAKEYECTVCGANHARSEIKLVGRVESAWIVRVICASCKTEFKLLVVVDESKAVAVKQDHLKQDHPSAARRRPPVTLDEVLDAHEFLRTYEGALDALLAVPLGRTRRTERGSDPT
jgi:hypothetical protein